MPDRSEDEKDRRWRKLGVVGSWVDAAARIIELFLRR